MSLSPEGRLPKPWVFVCEWWLGAGPEKCRGTCCRARLCQGSLEGQQQISCWHEGLHERSRSSTSHGLMLPLGCAPL